MIQRTLPYVQNTSVQNQGNYYSQVTEQALDLLCMQIQQLAGRTTQFRGVWTTNTAYAFGDIVQDGSNGAGTLSYYICNNANTSGVWATDLAAGDWAISVVATVPTSNNPITISGAVSGNGATSIITSFPANVVTNAALAKAPANTVLCNTSAVSANVVDATMAQFNAVLKSVISIKKQTFSASGTYTPSNGMLYCLVESVDGGAGGGGVKIASASNVGVAAGGYGGAYGRTLLTAAQISTSKTVTIGAGGAAGSNAGGNGGNGGATSLGSLHVGVTTPGGTGSTNAATSQSVAIPSAPSSYITADFSVAQQTYGVGYAFETTSSYGLQSIGGDSYWGQGGFPSNAFSGSNLAGNAGTGYGAGGSGAITMASTSGQSGGSGTSGFMLITEFCSI